MSKLETTRNYRLAKRLDDVAETRRRIVEATVELHGTVGPARTTISAVAERAGVQRSTVYRHFADEQELFGACVSHWTARNPWPRAGDWRREPDPTRRLEVGLSELYAYYRDNAQMFSNSLRDIDSVPPFVAEMIGAQVDELRTALLEPFGDPADALPAAVTMALDFRTWAVLGDAGVSPRDGATMMAKMISSLQKTTRPLD